VESYHTHSLEQDNPRREGAATWLFRTSIA